VAAMVLAIISFSSLLFVRLVFIPIIGAFLGFRAIKIIKERSHELTGLGLARVGTGLCIILTIASIAWDRYVWYTEVPEGYERISFSQLQPDKDVPESPIPPFAKTMDEKRIFVRGYMYPDETSGPQRRFVLVPDMGTCCFGGQPALTDMIEVTLKDPLYITYSQRMRRLGGTLKVDERKKPVSGLDGVYYQLDADYLK
ncbi:MAG: DUF4190 domain-containing protein, partial [Planctomycetota bacterium]